MNFWKYVKDKINYILVFIVYCLIILLYLNAMQVNNNVTIFMLLISSVLFIVTFIITFIRKNKYIKSINNILDNLNEKYLISEVMDKPKREENLAYYRILARSNKSMLENVNRVKEIQKDYKEYIESWVHEIKIPITSAKLLCENNKSEITDKIEDEVEEINNFVEQVLFYARLDNVSNDFLIRKVDLAEVVSKVISRNKKIMIQNNMRVELKNIDVLAYTDEKWLEFVLNQIMINSIKYKKEKDAVLYIEVAEQKDNVILQVKDNGIGIKKSELDRIFDKGFTGTNGRNSKRSTGIGLYLCKRLSKELGMDITAQSVENEYTTIKLIIPKKELLK